MNEKKLITDEQYAMHDCHLTDEDGCSTCERYWSQPVLRSDCCNAQTVGGIGTTVNPTWRHAICSDCGRPCMATVYDNRGRIYTSSMDEASIELALGK